MFILPHLNLQKRLEYMQRKVKQKEIYMCDLTLDSVDSEQKGIHPVLVYSCDIRNNSSSNVNIFPLTHAFKKSQPTHYILYNCTTELEFISNIFSLTLIPLS